MLSVADHRAYVAGDSTGLLALVPGLLVLLLYYRGLRETPASAATLAELAFPLAALSVNYVAFGATVTATQALGILALSATLVVMSLRGRERADRLGITTPARAFTEKSAGRW